MWKKGRKTMVHSTHARGFISPGKHIQVNKTHKASEGNPHELGEESAEESAERSMQRDKPAKV